MSATAREKHLETLEAAVFAWKKGNSTIAAESGRRLRPRLQNQVRPAPAHAGCAGRLQILLRLALVCLCKLTGALCTTQTPIRCEELHPAPLPGDQWSSTIEALATDAEVLLLAMRMIRVHSDADLDEWQGAVLHHDGTEWEQGAAWQPPITWNSGGLERRRLREALARERQPDAAAACARILSTWSGAGVIDCELESGAIDKWIQRMAEGKLRCPRTNPRKEGVPRHFQAAVRVARLLRDRRADLHAAWHAAFIKGAGNCTQAATKQEVIDGLEARLKEQAVAHASELEKQASELEALSNIKDQLADVARRAGARAKKAQQRSGKVSKVNRTTWRTMLKEMRSDLAAAAAEDVEAAHGAAMIRLRELKAEAHTAKRAALARQEAAETLSGERLSRARAAEEQATELHLRVEELEHELQEGAADALEKVATIRALKSEGRGAGGGSGGRSWPWWVRAMIMEQLVNGTPPTAIPANLVSDAAYLVPFLEVHVPSVKFCREMRSELRIVTETLAAYRIAKAVNWRQLFTDGTSRRQTALLTTIIAIDGPEGSLLPIVLRGAFVATGETSEQQVADILEKAIGRGGAKLEALRKTFEELFPGVPHDIPDRCEMNISKLGGGGAATSDNCNGALKVKRLLIEAVQEAVKASHSDAEWDALTEAERVKQLSVYEVDCWNHLRNVWLAKVTAALTTRLKETHKEELEAIEFRLRVATDMVLLLRALDKEFSLCANYPKGHGDLFKEWAVREHPRALLFHVWATSGARQDAAFEGAAPAYMNRTVWVEFLDERLRTPGADNILQENLFILLTSVAMVASLRVHAIILIALVLPHRWLAGNTHKLAAYGWSERSMGRALDLLEVAMEKVEADSKLFLDETFIMGIFTPLADELPPFKDYIKYMYDEEAMALAGSSITEHQYKKLRAELFNPTDVDNIDSTEISIELGQLATSEIVAEIRDPKKATSRHLTSAEGTLSWGKISDEEHEALKGKMAVNDPAESTFGATTREISTFGRIGFGEASGVATARRNKDFMRNTSTEKRSGKAKTVGGEAVGGKAVGGKAVGGEMGIFHAVTPEMREALITMAAGCVVAEAAVDRSDIEAQRAARRRKEELAAEKGREKAGEGYIDALYYFEMWGSPACWKTPAKATAEYGKLNSTAAKLEALKEQIRIRVLGLGWKDLACAWSAEGKAFPPAQLFAHLNTIIIAQAKRPIPTAPPAPGMVRKALPQFGKRTAQVAGLDEREALGGAAIVEAARALKASREAKGIGDSYSVRQGSQPAHESLLGARVEVVFHYTLPEGVFGQALMWCSGEVVDLDPRPYTSFPKGKSALVRWDANDRVTPPEPVTTLGCKLLPSKWNKDDVGAWHMGLDYCPIQEPPPE